jgi:hypothetical protein
MASALLAPPELAGAGAGRGRGRGRGGPWHRELE